MGSTLLAVWLLYVGAMITPGQNVLLVTQLAASRNRPSARFAGIGVAVGAGMWATCAILGIHAVFNAFPWLRLSLQIAGGLYLIYVAFKLWNAHRPDLQKETQPLSSFAAFRMRLLTNVTNPKAALFFGSVFATSFPAHPTTALQIAAVAVVVLSALVWYFLLAQFFCVELHAECL